MSRANDKAKFLAAIRTANLPKLMQCELTLRVTIAKAKAGQKFASTLAEMEEFMAAVQAAKSKF